MTPTLRPFTRRRWRCAGGGRCQLGHGLFVVLQSFPTGSSSTKCDIRMASRPQRPGPTSRTAPGVSTETRRPAPRTAHRTVLPAAGPRPFPPGSQRSLRTETGSCYVMVRKPSREPSTAVRRHAKQAWCFLCSGLPPLGRSSCCGRADLLLFSPGLLSTPGPLHVRCPPPGRPCLHRAWWTLSCLSF